MPPVRPSLLSLALRALPDMLAGGVLALKLGTLAVNAVAFPRLRPAPGRADLARASILVPARDEAHNLGRTLPALLAQGAGEVIVLDDGSTDGTAELARRLGARVIAGAPLPPGWHGKPWACQQLADAARGALLVFTDADVCWQPGALGALLAERGRADADLLTVWPRQEARTPGERLIVPLVDDVLLSLLPAPLIAQPYPAASAGNGQLMCFTRPAYTALGGHARVAGEVIEDLRLATLVKEGGGRLAIALGGDLVGVRMYRSYREVVEGFGKNLLAAHGGSRARLAASWGLHALVYTLPALRGRRWLVGAALLEGLLVRALTGRTRPADLLETLAAPALPLAALPIYLRAARRRYTWKGRTYERAPTALPAPDVQRRAA